TGLEGGFQTRQAIGAVQDGQKDHPAGRGLLGRLALEGEVPRLRHSVSKVFSCPPRHGHLAGVTPRLGKNRTLRASEGSGGKPLSLRPSKTRRFRVSTAWVGAWRKSNDFGQPRVCLRSATTSIPRVFGRIGRFCSVTPGTAPCTAPVA